MGFDPKSYSFLVEKVGTLLRSIDPRATLILGSLVDDSQGWFEEIEPGRLAPYVGGIALADPIDLGAWRDLIGASWPATHLWLYADPGAAGPDAFLARFHEARALGAEMVVAPAGSDAAGALLHLIQRLPSRFSPAAASEGLVRFEDPLGPEQAVIVLDPLLTAIDAGPDPVARIRAFDLATGEALVTGTRSPGPPAAPSVIEIPAGARPALLLFAVNKGLHASPETVGVTSERVLTVEEILAGERAFEAGQARALHHYQAKATIPYHYRAETLAQAIDVVSVNRFFWKDGTGDYEEIDLLVNGARWRGAAPALPFIQAERVKEVPLEIRLDKSYTYRLEGKEKVDGREVYVVAFEPASDAAGLYSGEVLVDATSFARVRIRLVQHDLKAPITSSTDVIDYAPVDPSTGRQSPEAELWLPVRGYRQMVFTAVGRAVVAERLVSYEDFSINAEQFETLRGQAYASGRPILRDDANGYSYLEAGEDGLRERKADSLQNVAFFAGLGFDSDGSIGTPIAGMNYFNFDWRNTGTQVDIAFAGVLLDAAWTNPALGDTLWELTLNGQLVALDETFHRTVEAGRLDGQDVETRRQQLLATLSHPITPFQRAVFQAEVDYDDYGADSDTDPNFIVPTTGFSGIGTLRWNYHRNGYQVDAWYSSGHRLSWETWGIDDPNAPGARTGGGPDDDQYTRTGLSAFKSFHAGARQSLSLGISAFDGSSLDRFSRFRIGDFRNARVRGFSSKDITFDRGVTGQVAWQFPLPGTGVGIDLGVDAALIENEEDFDGRQTLFGGGAAVSFHGPWGTLMTLRTHFQLGSSIDSDTSGVSIRALMIKTLDHWPRRRSPAGKD